MLIYREVNQVNYEYYKTYVVLAETKNFSTTAKKMHVAQSTVSNRIKELETYLNHVLFLRTNKSVELTLAGEALMTYAKRILMIEEDAIQGMGNLKFKGQIKIGSPHAVYSGHLKPALKMFMRNKEDVSIKVMISHTHDLLEKLSDGVIDMAFVSYMPKSHDVDDLLTVHDKVILIAKNTNEFVDEINLEDVEHIKLLHSDMGDSFEQWLKEIMGKRMNHAFYIDQISEVMDYVLEGLGYAFVPESISRKLINAQSIKQVKLQNDSACDVENFVMSHHLIIKKSNVSRCRSIADEIILNIEGNE